MNIIVILPVIWALVMLVIVFSMFHKNIEGWFNMIDRRGLISDATVWDKYNKMTAYGEVDLTQYSLMDGKTFNLRIKYDGVGEEDTTNSFRDPSVDKVINQAYDWSVTKGFIK